MIPKPKTKVERLLSTPYAYEVIIAFFLVFGGVANSIKGYYGEPSVWIGTLWAISAAGVLVTSVFKSIAMWHAHKESETTHELDGCLHVLHSYLISDLDASSCRVRAAIHVPTDGGQQLLQVTEYVGDKYSSGKAGRKFPVQSGIVGRAYRSREALVATKQNEDREAFLHELINEWGYSEKDALEVDPYSKTWMAVPITKSGDGPVFGVIFVDATILEFFTEKRQEFVLFATSGIADYVVRRYKSRGGH